jgi:hypothetical protein
LKGSLCLQKLPNLGDNNRFPGVFITRESITYTNNSPNIQKNLKSFMGMSTGTRKLFDEKKNGDKNLLTLFL